MKTDRKEELKISHEKHQIVHELSNLFNLNEISANKNINTEINHINKENHKRRQKKPHIKKKIRVKKLKINIPKALTIKKQKSKNSLNDYGKNNKEQKNINLKEYCRLEGEINTLPESPEKKAHFQIPNFMNLDNSQKFGKVSINKDIEVNTKININGMDNNIASSKKYGAVKFEKVDGNSDPFEKKNEFNECNKENTLFKKNSFIENQNSIRKKILFTPQEIEKANINLAQKLNDKENKKESSLSKFNGFTIIFENSINESDESLENVEEITFNQNDDDYHNEISIDHIDNLIPQNFNGSNEHINLSLIENINCNYKKKNN